MIALIYLFGGATALIAPMKFFLALKLGLAHD